MKRSFIAFCNGDSIRKIDSLSHKQERIALEPFEGQKVVVTIENFKRDRTLSQNGYLHKIFEWLEEETGGDRRQLKEALKARFGLREALTDKDGVELCDDNGEVIETLVSTSDYTTEQMTEFIDKIRQWSNDFLGYVIPDADRYRSFNIK